MKRVRPFTLLGTVVMSLGVYLLTTLDVSSTPAIVVPYLIVRPRAPGAGEDSLRPLFTQVPSTGVLRSPLAGVRVRRGFGSLFCRVTMFRSAGLCSACSKSTKGY